MSDAAGQLLELMVFAMFGSYAVIVGMARRGLAGRGLRGGGAVRACAGGGAAWRCSAATCPARNRVFIGWFGPRGIGTLVLGLLIVNRGRDRAGAADHSGGGRRRSR